MVNPKLCHLYSMSTGRLATRSFFRYSQESESAISSLSRILSLDPSRFGDIIYDPFLGSGTMVICAIGLHC
jgi:hypothetical protein